MPSSAVWSSGVAKDMSPPRKTRPGRSRPAPHLAETRPLSQGVQAGRKALRIRHINGMEVRKKGPRGFKKEAHGGSSEPPEPPICCSLVTTSGYANVAGYAAGST